MLSDRAALSVECVRRDGDACVLALSGELSQRSAELATNPLMKALASGGRVLVDVSALRLSWSPAVQVLPSILAGSGGWPGARLVLFGADANLARSLSALRVTMTVPVAPDETSARLLLDQRPPAVTRHVHLAQVPSAPRRARLFVEAACIDWQLDTIRDDAMVVASELVANVVAHAGTACRLALRWNDRGLTIAVYDYRPDRLPPLPPLPPLRPVDIGQRLGGLFVVATLSRDWGVTRTAGGKSVWAVLPATDSEDHSWVIRKAAHHAVRAVLAHGVNSRQASTAVRRITARLIEDHGAGAARDMAEALTLELIEAGSVIASISDRGEHNGGRPGTAPGR